MCGSAQASSSSISQRCRIDYNLTENHRLTGTTATIWAERDRDYLNGGDVRFPGGTNSSLFHSTRPLHSLTLRSTLSANTVNELRAGFTAYGGASYFGDTSSNGPPTFEDQDGYAINFPDFSDPALTNWHVQNNPSWRSAPTAEIANTLNWQKGSHAFMFGGSWLRASAWEKAQNQVEGINLGFNNTSDPAIGLFNTTNFPGASGGQLTDARDLYGTLTGRVTAVTGQAALDPDTNQYVSLGPRTREGRIDMLSGFVQDSWRMTPALTINAGAPLRPPAAVHAGQRHHVERDHGVGLWHFRRGTRWKLRQLQFPAAWFHTGRHTRIHPVDERHAGLRHRLQQLLAERRRRLAAERRERVDAEDPRRSGTGDASVRAIPWRTNVRGWPCLRANSGSTRAAR